MSRKRKKRKRKKHGSEHHILPRSRGGPEDPFWNKADKPIEKHQAFHTLSRTSFNENLLPCEFINKINEQWTKKSGGLKKSRLTKKQIEAWEVLFNTSPKKAVEVIKKEWTLKWCFRFKECSRFDNLKKKCPVLKLYKEGKLR